MPHKLADPATLDKTCQRFWTDWRGSEMVWREWGSGPPLILLHGAFGSWTHWLKNIRALSARHRVLVPDMPGFGDSDSPAKGNPIEEMTSALCTGLQTLCSPTDKVNLVGFSFGTLLAGSLAARLNAENPGALHRLVLIAPAGLGITVGRFDDLGRILPGMSEFERRAAHRRNLGITMIADPAKITEETIDLQIRNVARKRVSGKPFSRADVLRRACTDLDVERIDVIHGALDSYKLRSEPAYSRALAELHPRLRRHEIARAGHWVQYERSKKFNSLLERCICDD